MTMLHACLLGAALVSIAAAQCDTQVLFVVDRSSSVRDSFSKAQEFVKKITSDVLQIGPERHAVALLTYSGRLYKRTQYDWNVATSNEAFLALVDGLQQIGGSTDTSLALKDALDLLKERPRSSATTVVITITDGRSWEDPEAAAEAIRSQISNSQTFSISVSEDMDDYNLAELISISGSAQRTFIGSSALNELVDAIRPALQCSAPPPTQATETATDASAAQATGSEDTVDTQFSSDDGYGGVGSVPASQPGTNPTDVGVGGDSETGDATASDPATGGVAASCDRQPYIETCQLGAIEYSAQFTLRWYVNDGMCCTYPKAYCAGDEINQDSSIRTKEACEELCLGKKK